MTQNTHIPEWLTDIQNRSWEPEIIISGLIITSLFLIQKSVFNLHASLIQDFGLNALFVNLAYNCITIGLTSLKITIVVHLALRGMWAGVIGLSYVFPNGVDKSRLNKKEQTRTYETPLEMTIRLEKACSLLFSLNITLLSLFVTAAVFYIPFSLIFMWTERLINTSFWITTLVSFVIFIIIVNGIEYLAKKFNPKVSLSLNILAVLKTNRIKIKVLGLCIIIASIVISMQSLIRFQFNNHRTAFAQSSKYPEIDPELYESRRNPDYRIAKASIQAFNIKNRTLTLFISSYREDRILYKHKEAFSKLSESEQSDIGIPDLYSISIDGTTISQPGVFRTHHRETGQSGYEWLIPIDSLTPGIHTLSISKAFLNRTEKTYEWKKNWENILFNKVQ